MSPKLATVSVLGMTYWSTSIYRDTKPFPFTIILDNWTTGMFSTVQYHRSRVGETVADQTYTKR